MKLEHYVFENIPLPYAYSSMEPFIDTKTMELHHDRHLQTYVDNLNLALENYPMYHDWSLDMLICMSSKLPREIRTAVKNNAGGVYNHNFYFFTLSPKSSKEPTGVLKNKIEEQFGSYENFKSQWKKAALSVFGSGWAWLVSNQHGKLSILTTANQETPLTQNLCPILLIDVWEHAYYLKHYNKRADYIEDWFQVVNWDMADRNYMKSMWLGY